MTNPEHVLRCPCAQTQKLCGHGRPQPQLGMAGEVGNGPFRRVRVRSVMDRYGMAGMASSHTAGSRLACKVQSWLGVSRNGAAPCGLAGMVSQAPDGNVSVGQVKSGHGFCFRGSIHRVHFECNQDG